MPEDDNSTIKNISKSSRGSHVEILVGRLKHTFEEYLPVVSLHFQVIKSFAFTYRIVASNLPQPMEGVLNVKLEEKN